MTRRRRPRRGAAAPVTDRSTSSSRVIPSDFDTWARAPRAIAASTVATSSAALRMTTRASGCLARTCSRATHPPPPGMYRSRIRTSGITRSYSATAAPASSTSATTTRSGSLDRLCTRPQRRTSLSSATRIRIMTAPAHLMGKRATTLVPPSGGGSMTRLPPTSLRVSSSSRRPKWPWGAGRVGSKPIPLVLHHDDEVTVLGSQRDARSRRAGVPDHVAQGLAQHPVPEDGRVDRQRLVADGGVDAHVDLDAGVAHLAEEQLARGHESALVEVGRGRCP